MDLHLLLQNLQINDATLETLNATDLYQDQKDSIDQDTLDLLRGLLCGLQCKELCGDLNEASGILLSDRTWMESAGAILNLLPRISAIVSSVQQREVLNAIWAIVYICSKRLALDSLNCMGYRVKSSTDRRLLQKEIVELKSYIEKDEPSEIRAMLNRGGMHVDKFSKLAHGKMDALDILTYWEEVRYLIWNVLSRLWSYDDSWNNLTMRQRLAELQLKISFMHAHFRCRASPSARTATLPAPAYKTSGSRKKESLNPRLNRRRAGRKTWEQHIKRVHTPQGPAKVKPSEINRLANSKLNIRQIKNIVATAQALATEEGSCVLYSHLETVINANMQASY